MSRVTDARLRGEWLTALKFSSLSDSAWRVFTGALMWSAEQETDGVIPARFLRSLHPSFDDLPGVYEEISAAGLWVMTDEQVDLIGWAKRGIDGLGQSTADQVRTYREGSRKRQQEYRDRRKGLQSAQPLGGGVEALSSGSVMRNATRDITDNATANVGSLSSIDRSKERAYATHDVTRNAEPPSRFCSKHPDGSGGVPCGACRDARLAREDWEKTQTPTTPLVPRHNPAEFCWKAGHEEYPISATTPCLKCEREKAALREVAS